MIQWFRRWKANRQLRKECGQCIENVAAFIQLFSDDELENMNIGFPSASSPYLGFPERVYWLDWKIPYPVSNLDERVRISLTSRNIIMSRVVETDPYPLLVKEYFITYPNSIRDLRHIHIRAREILLREGVL